MPKKYQQFYSPTLIEHFINKGRQCPKCKANSKYYDNYRTKTYTFMYFDCPKCNFDCTVIVKTSDFKKAIENGNK